MNLVGWLGGGTAPLVVGVIAEFHGLGWAISCAAGVYLLAAGFLLVATVFLVRGKGPGL
jgi:hypothetical protein